MNDSKNYKGGEQRLWSGFKGPGEAPFLTQGWINLVETEELADKDGQ